MQRQELEGNEKALGKEHRDTLRSVNKPGDGAAGPGEVRKVRGDEPASAGREREGAALGKEHPDMVASLYCLAYLYNQRKWYDTACEYNPQAEVYLSIS